MAEDKTDLWWSAYLYASEGYKKPKIPEKDMVLSYEKDYKSTGISFYLKNLNWKRLKSACEPVRASSGNWKKWVCVCGNERCRYISVSFESKGKYW
jgi:hypothetical protein